MTQQHDAPEGGAEWKLVPTDCTVEMMRAFWDTGPYPLKPFQEGYRAILLAAPTAPVEQDWRSRAEKAEADLKVEREITANLTWAIESLQSEKALAPTPPAPSGLVDALRAYLAALDDLRRAGAKEDRQVALIQAERAMTLALDATLSGQQGGAVPAGDLRPGVEAAKKLVRETFTRAPEVVSELVARFDRLAEQPALAGTSVDPEMPLPCDVKVAPATIIRKGVPLRTLLLSIKQRVGRLDQDTRFHETAPAGTGADGVEGLLIKPLDWQETFTDRGDGTQEVTGWEAATGFSEWYSVESYMSSDSYGYQALLGHEVLKSTDDPDAAKEHAQADYERRIRAALDAGSSEEGR